MTNEIKTAFYITDIKQGEAAFRVAALYRDGILDRLEVRNKAEMSRVGQIVLGVVDTVEKSIGGAFVRIGHTEKAFLPMKTEKWQDSSKRPFMITKDAQGVKQAVCTERLSIAGRFAVVTEGKSRLTFSAKLSASEKKRIREALGTEEKDLSFSDGGYDILIRTNAAAATADEIKAEIDEMTGELKAVWEKAKTASTYAVLYEPAPFYEVMLRDLPERPETIVSDIPKVNNEIDGCQMYSNPGLSFPEYIDLPHTLDKLRQRVAWLKSGAYLVIEPTEALTAIDVNSGHMKKGRHPQETYRLVNEEAIAEAARQIRLRNISGMIVIDLIKMKDESDRNALLTYAKQVFSRDPLHSDVLDISKMGLLEIVRQRKSAPLAEVIHAGI